MPTAMAGRRNEDCGPTLKLTTADAFTSPCNTAHRTRCISAPTRHRWPWPPDHDVDTTRRPQLLSSLRDARFTRGFADGRRKGQKTHT